MRALDKTIDQGGVVFTTTVPSPIGPLTLTSDGDALTGVHMAGQAHAPAGDHTWASEEGPFVLAREQLAAYFAGELTQFDLRLHLEGTEFQQTVWQRLREIPYGETISYSELAVRVGNPHACRAVGLANGRNPVAVIVPCHRVIASGGGLGGYGGGLDRKSWLLSHEAAVRRRAVAV